MFRLKIKKTQVVGGELHYHLLLEARRGGHWTVVGVIMLHAEEWIEVLRFCEAFHIQVFTGEAFSSQTSEAAPAR